MSLLRRSSQVLSQLVLQLQGSAPATRLVAARGQATASDSLVVQRKGEIGEVSGVPEEHLKRKVLIYRPARQATQQGRRGTEAWKIRFNSVDKWENPLMGWTSTADPLSNVGDAALRFATKEAAVEFAEKYGWEYQVVEPKVERPKVKAYANNFKWRGPPPVTD